MILEDSYRLTLSCFLTLLISCVALAGKIEDESNLNASQTLNLNKSYVTDLQRSGPDIELDHLIETPGNQSLVTGDSKPLDLLIDKGSFVKPFIEQTLSPKMLLQSETKMPYLSWADDLTSIHEQLSSDSMLADWHSFKSQVKLNKNAIEEVFRIDNAVSGSHSGQLIPYQNTSSVSSMSGNSGSNFNGNETDSVPAIFKLIYTILNSRQNYPVTFYSVLFLLAFFIIIKTVLIIFSKTR